MLVYGKIENFKYSGQKIDWKYFEGKRVKIEVSESRNNRSDLQNRYYWGVVLKYLSDETGHTKDELHEIFKLEYSKPVAMIFQGKAYNIPKSTTALNTMEFNDYITKIRDFASSVLNCYIPEPNEELK